MYVCMHAYTHTYVYVHFMERIEAFVQAGSHARDWPRPNDDIMCISRERQGAY